ncbi:CheR family methyltransferase [Desulfovibrio aminophilus]|uniref:CheR family methyltransferase n=1 Tax=Desulfovibrio aminophilus TaxID=81425 RepID=UPI003398037A
MSLFSGAITLRAATPITDSEFKELRDFIYQRSGIWVDEKRKYLFENRFHKRLATLGLKSFDEYIKLLKYDPRSQEEMKSLWEIITTNETSFFRDIKQLESFQNVILAEVLAEQRKKGKFDLNIWSAGCSSGEEPYTLAMIISDSLGLELPKWRVTITAVDLSPAMVAKAKEAVYGEYSFKTTTEAQKKKYFVPAGTDLKVKPEIARMVNFQQMNLNDDAAVRRVPKSQIVFCRNVIIYFDEAMRTKVARAFYDNLLPGGYLLLGHSETLHKISTAFRPKFIPGAMAYRKE